MKNGKFNKTNPAQSHSDPALEQRSPNLPAYESVSQDNQSDQSDSSVEPHTDNHFPSNLPKGEILSDTGSAAMAQREDQVVDSAPKEEPHSETGRKEPHPETGSVNLSPDKLSAMLHEAYLRGRNENIEARIEAECATRKVRATATDLFIRGLTGAAKTLFRPGRRSIWPPF